MSIRRVYCHPKVKSNVNRVAIMRGPVVYCAEGADNNGKAINLPLKDDAKLSCQYRKEMLGGINVIHGKSGNLAAGAGKSNQQINLIPYYAWAHRGLGEMAIWLKRE